MKLFLVLFLTVLILLFKCVELRELRFVQAIWRHGDRSPTKLPYPNDPNGVNHWPRGWSQLTEVWVLNERFWDGISSRKWGK